MKTNRIIIGIVVIALSFSLASVTAVQAKTYREGKTYSLKGKVKKVNFYHTNGQRLSNYVLKLSKPIKVKSSWGKKIKVKSLDIFTTNSGKVRKKIKKYLGKKVKIKGEIFSPGTAWWYNLFVIEPRNAKCIKKCSSKLKTNNKRTFY